MAAAAERVLGKRITGGLVNVKYGHVTSLRQSARSPVTTTRTAPGCSHLLATRRTSGAVTASMRAARVS